jgi:CubicO group peptidase (beta-lactamase class C family)
MVNRLPHARARISAAPVSVSASLAASAFLFLFLCACDPAGPRPGSGRAPWPDSNWPVTSPESAGFPSDFAARADAFIRDSLPALRGALVILRGWDVYEHYAPGLAADSLHDMQSAGKSVLSALVGISLGKGRFRNLDVTMEDLLPQGREEECRPQAEVVTIGNLLDMTSGVPDAAYEDWSAQKDRVRYALSRPLVHAPGAAFLYSNMAAHLLSASLSAVTGRSALSLADSELFAPLGISRREWPVDSAGLNTGDGELRLTLPDMARFGYLYLRGGEWDGRAVLPEGWAAQSVAAHSQGGDPEGDAYGYLWWVGREGKHACYYAAGWGGQLIEIIPDLDLVVALASSTDAAHRETRRFVERAVLPGLDGM